MNEFMNYRFIERPGSGTTLAIGLAYKVKIEIDFVYYIKVAVICNKCK